MKKMCAILLTFLLLTSTVWAEDFDTPIDTPPVSPVTCINGCSGLSVLLCDHSPYPDGTSKHGSCTISWYQAHYLGYYCYTCGNLQSSASIGIGNGLHDCYVRHSSCGKGKVSFCMGGTHGV